MVGRYWQVKMEALGEKSVTLPVGPPQVLHIFAEDWTRAPEAKGRWLSAWAITRTKLHSTIQLVPRSKHISSRL
jgi:hypothetical protein